MQTNQNGTDRLPDMEAFPECEVFVVGSARWRWCRNEFGDVRKSNAFRRGHGLPEIINTPAVDSDHTKASAQTVRRSPTKFREPQSAQRRGPGGHLKTMLSQMGLSFTSGCSCDDRVRQMDQWGADGCRQNLDTILGWLNEAAKSQPWRAWVMAGTLAAWSGLPVTIPGLVDEAIRRSEA